METKSPAEHHHHSHNPVLGENTELYFSLLCGFFLAVGFVLSFYEIESWIWQLLLAVSYFFGGFYTAKEAIATISKGGFEIDFLMLVAAIGAALLGEYAEGALLLFLFSLGHALEHYAMNRARNSIKALADLAPPTAILLRDSAEKEVLIETLNVGDRILVKPNSKIPADGVVVKGQGSVDQAPITGESVPVEKIAIAQDSADSEEKIASQNQVFAGTINGNSVLEVRVVKAASDSTISRLIKMVQEAEKQKSPTQHFTDKFEKIFVPLILVMVILLCFAFLVIDEPFSSSFYRAMAVLVASSPCALAISTPSAVLSGIARAARGGVLIKGGRPLEDLGAVNAVAFDKTGTLTEGKPRLTNISTLSGSEADFLRLLISVENKSDHPLALAIVNGIKEKYPEIRPGHVSEVKSVTGKGVRSVVDGDEVLIGNMALFPELDKDVEKRIKQLEQAGNTTMLLKKGSEYIGIVSLMDVPRNEAKATLSRLSKLGIKNMVMLSGDNQSVADSVATEIGLTEARGNLMPEDKVKALADLKQRYGKVAMIGDGVNDAPAMANSTVGIAMGAAGSDVALETADIALMGDKLNLLPFAIGLSRQTRRIIKQNLWISLGMVAILVPLTISGLATIGPAVIAHEGSTLLVVLNALRLLVYEEK